MFNHFTLSQSSHGDRRTSGSNDPDEIQRHLRDCSRANGRLHSLRCKAEAADSFLSGRFISTIVIAGGLLALCAYW